MRIGLFTSLARGGPVEHALVLARALVARGREVRAVCATSDLAVRFEAAGAEAVEVSLRRGIDRAGAAEIRAATAGLEVLHAHDRRSALWLRLLPRRSRRVALVQTVHGLPDPFLPPPAGPGRPGWRALAAYRGLDAKLAWRCDAVITPTEAMRRMLVQRLGYPRPRLTVIPNGVPVPPMREEQGTVVGTLCELQPVKDLGTFLAAAALVPDAPLAVYGTGPEEPRLRQRGRELGLAGRLEFRGHVPSAEALAHMRILVIASVMENAPMSMLEAMAAGVPVVATAVGGIPELAPDGTASLVPPRDPRKMAAAIEGLLADPAAARVQAERAHAHAEASLGADLMAGRMDAVYRRALESRRP